MLLKKMTLTNFRSFKGEHEISFSTDIDKNVTLIIAENGAGKTTLAQAFQWVLYSKTVGFNNKSVLNSIVENEMMLNSENKVIAKLELEHNKIDYTIIRTQVYKKDLIGCIKSDNTVLDIYIKKDDGKTVVNQSYNNISTISNILPETLSKYFFFDGERIEKMAMEVSFGKSEEFKNAVQNILGLTALIKAIEHLNPNSKNSVIGRLNAQRDAEGDHKTIELREIIYDSNEKKGSNIQRIEKIEEEIDYYQTEVEKIKGEILSYADAEKMQQELNKLNGNLNQEIQKKNNSISLMMSNFTKQTYTFMSKHLIKYALIELKNTDNIDKGIPYVRDETIKFLIERKKCLCGADLSNPTSEAVRNLIELLDYIPPESLGTSISGFQDKSNSTIKQAENYFMNINAQLRDIRERNDVIVTLKTNIGDIDKSILKLSNTKITDLKNRQKDIENNLNDLVNEKNNLVSDNLYLDKSISNAEAEISRLQLKIDRNKIIEEQILYAREVYNKLKSTYVNQEAETRENLEIIINDLFKQIYAGGITIKIDDKYRITSYVNELEETTSKIDANTAKSYSIIFAFIVGVISLAKQKVKERNNDIVTDEYPLVMDAPLSSFDQKRIKNICEVIPNIARQVIIFIKDTDGNIAKSELGNKVGLEYELALIDKQIPLESKIIRSGE